MLWMQSYVWEPGTNTNTLIQLSLSEIEDEMLKKEGARNVNVSREGKTFPLINEP